METITFHIRGVTPLLMHNGQLANPLNPFAKQIKEITGKRKKTEEDYNAIFRLEWEGGLYYDPKLGPYIPGANMDACLIEGARQNKRGKDVERSAQTVEDKIPLQYKGPRDLDAMYETMKDIRNVRIGTSTTQRCRPVFNEWEAKFSVLYNPEAMNPSDIRLCLESAGMIGLMELPRYGRFEVVGNGKAA